VNLFISQRPDIHWLNNSLTTKIKKIPQLLFLDLGFKAFMFPRTY